MIAKRANPITELNLVTVRAAGIQAPNIYRAEQPPQTRQLERYFRGESAAIAVGAITPAFHRFSLSKGQFDLVHVIEAIATQTGPCDLAISTWTIGSRDLEDFEKLFTAARFRSIRLLLDFGFQRRGPEVIGLVRKVFGPKSIALTQNHSKFITFGNDTWRIVCRTSMNLNSKPRLESMELKDDPALYDFVETFLSEAFTRQRTFSPPQRLNPILHGRIRPAAQDDGTPDLFGKVKTLDSATLYKLFRQQKANDFLGTLNPGSNLYGFTKGDFSLVDLIRAVSDRIGRCDISVSLWTMNKYHFGDFQALVDEKRFSSIRFMFDFSFQRRRVEQIGYLRKLFGPEAVIVTQSHCKFVTFGNAAWKLVCLTSMNLNLNRRNEDVELRDDPELYDFLDRFLDDMFQRHEAKAQAKHRFKDTSAEFETIRS